MAAQGATGKATEKQAAGVDSAHGVQVGALHAKGMHIHETIYRVGSGGAAVIQGLKCALWCLGVCDDLMAEPFGRLADAQRRLIQEHLDEIEFPVGLPRPARGGRAAC